MHFLLGYQGVDEKGSDSPVWCEVSFPKFDNSPFESALANEDEKLLAQLSGSEVFFHHVPIGFDFFDQHRDLIFCSDEFLEVLRSNNVDFFSVAIKALMQRSKTKEIIEIKNKKYSIVIFRSKSYCVDFARSQLRVERAKDGRVVYEDEILQRKSIKYLYKLVIDEGETQGLNLFRPYEKNNLLVVSENLFIELRSSSLKGLGLVPTPDFDLLDLPSFRGDKRIIDDGTQEILFFGPKGRSMSRVL
jgi:hypothetical protein